MSKFFKFKKKDKASIAKAPKTEPVRWVIGLDFGTYGTGFCYKAVNNPEINTCNKWPGRHEPPYCKALTALLYRNAEPIAWGWEAWRRYSELDEKQKGNYHYVTQFKLALDSAANSRCQLPPGLSVVQVIADFLRMFTSHCIHNVLADVYRNSDVSIGSIQWCLTVPAIWRDDQKDAMREAAHLAGMIPTRFSDRLRFILEPEAAALHAHDSQLLRQALQPGTKVMMLDAGGGTVDLTVHTVQRSGGKLVLEETVPGRGGFCGGTYVDWEFECWFRSKVGEAAFNAWKARCPGEYLQLTASWEVEKRLFEPRGAATRPSPYIIIPRDLRYSMDERLAAELQKATGCHDRVFISWQEMAAFFEPHVQKIVQLANGLAASCPGGRVDRVLLAGGFCKSPYLAARLRESLPGRTCPADPARVFVPDTPESIIMQGAVLGYSTGGGHPIIASRVVKLTYGYNVSRQAGADVPANRKVWDSETSCWREDYFERLAVMNQNIKVDEVVTVSLGAWAPSQTSFHVSLYTVPSATARYLDAPGMQKHATLEVPVVRGCKDFVKVSFMFGQAEVKIVASDGKALSEPIAVRASYCRNSF